MARKASVRYWPSRGTWQAPDGTTQHGAYCTTLGGRQQVLAVGPDDAPDGATYKAALKAWLDLLALNNADRAGDANHACVVFELYLQHIKVNRSPGTYGLRQKHLAAFCASGLADKPVAYLSIFDVERWLDSQKEQRILKCSDGKVRRHGWGSATIRTALTSLNAAFNWARRRRLIQTNPLEGIQLPAPRSRSRVFLIDPATHLRILNRAPAEMKPLVIALQASGCRPGELAMATASAWDEQLGALVYHAEQRRLDGEARHKTAGHGSERRIFFSGAALAVVRELVQRYPQGSLFRLRGRPVTAAKVADRFKILRQQLKLPHLNAYSYRHTYATRWLEGGGSIDDLAALMGNTPDIIRQHYAHLIDNPDRLRQLAERFAARLPEQPPEGDKGPGTLPFKVAE